MKNIPIRVGDFIEFNGTRIHKGNPVRGTVTSIGPGFFDIKLAHDIEGLSSIWYEGSERAFRFDLISDLKIIDKK